MAWAYVGANPALDTIFEGVFFRFFVIFTTRKPVELLWHQVDWAGIRTARTANTSLFRLWFCIFKIVWCKQAVDNFGHWCIKIGKFQSHHWATRKHWITFIKLITSVRQYLRNWCTKSDPIITFFRNFITCKGDHSFN